MHVDHAREQMHSELLTWKEREREKTTYEKYRPPEMHSCCILAPLSSFPLVYIFLVYVKMVVVPETLLYTGTHSLLKFNRHRFTLYKALYKGILKFV